MLGDKHTYLINKVFLSLLSSAFLALSHSYCQCALLYFFKQNAVPGELGAVIGSLKKGSHDIPWHSLHWRQGFLKERKPRPGSIVANPHILIIGAKFPL